MFDEIFFPVDIKPITKNGKPTKKTKVFRTDTHEIISMLSDKYTLIRNIDLHNAIKDIFGDVVVDSFFSDGYKFRWDYVIPTTTREVFPGDNVSLMISVYNSYDGSRKLRINANIMRLICSNNMRVGKSIYEDSFLHKSTDSNKIIKSIKGNLICHNEYFDSSIHILQGMKERLLTMEVKAELIKRLTSFPSYVMVDLLTKIVNPENKNLYDIYNVITSYTTHDLDIKNSNREDVAEDLNKMIISI